MRISFEVYGEKQVERELLRMAGAAANAEPAFQAVGERMMEIEEEQFESQGIRSSGGWPPLKATTLAAKARKGHDLRILHATLRLRRSLTERGPDNMFFTWPHQMVFGSFVGYGGIHQHGAPAANIPQRRPLEFTELDRRQMVKILQHFIMTGRLP